MVVKKIYDRLLKEYGYQGWWPLIGYDGVNVTKTGSINGYHPGEYDFPRNDDEKFEIICGALLTQNTSWVNVEKALINLKEAGLLGMREIAGGDIEKIKECIKPAGYYNQKGERLKILAEYFWGLGGRVPSRNELLMLKGVGPETADSILLYAYGVSSFVVDSYTRRIVEGLKLIEKGRSYGEIKRFFEAGLGKVGSGERGVGSGEVVDGGGGEKSIDFKIYQEFHALLARHAKRFYLGNKNGEGDFLREIVSV
jgi:endonuclease III related protein